MRSFEELLAEGANAPVDGWDFGWFAGRATEQRPAWGYARMLAERVGVADAVLDVQTGGGEVYAEVLRRAARRPSVAAATESWAPNLALARDNLAPMGVTVAESADGAALPFPDAAFDLVASRHPTVTDWAETARVLAPGGVYLSQQIGAGSMRELSEFFLGPVDPGTGRLPETLAAGARGAGLVVTEVRTQALRTEFYDVAAVIVFLRKVIWTVPGFDVDRFRERLAAMDALIRAEGPFVAHSQRFLLAARRP
ncbi:class I SAM-dependent methyltransferase [Catellatospora methionotrophica]|uniref:class I SAM-dependent methyltransferase n=1 Tax=Catellatospora methionotrophica TaxID=121620 RepID=UPI00140AAFC4|nr:methyltransferase domain-containing protein [Catellatospora methionotrophica]